MKGTGDPFQVRDHPRGRGEHWDALHPLFDQWGPSPRARGARVLNDHGCSPFGTIPAGAGSTLQLITAASRRGDHPRGRGEHLTHEPDPTAAEGPSPRARGAPAHHPRGLSLRGTIPAGAGSTRTSRPRRAPRRDHPRGRGEHSAASHALHTWPGPSPRARGAPGRSKPVCSTLGTIPAGAGSTTSRRPPASTARDHPRGRGEHHTRCPPVDGTVGPSPRARGAQPVLVRQEDRRGTIPAGAGSTCSRARSASTTRDHPRGRGEHSRRRQERERPQGPSPRARGARDREGCSRVTHRTIPAGAGSTLPDLRLYPRRTSFLITFAETGKTLKQCAEGQTVAGRAVNEAVTLESVLEHTGLDVGRP